MTSYDDEEDFAISRCMLNNIPQLQVCRRELVLRDGTCCWSKLAFRGTKKLP